MKSDSVVNGRMLANCFEDEREILDLHSISWKHKRECVRRTVQREEQRIR